MIEAGPLLWLGDISDSADRAEQLNFDIEYLGFSIYNEF